MSSVRSRFRVLVSTNTTACVPARFICALNLPSTKSKLYIWSYPHFAIHLLYIGICILVPPVVTLLARHVPANLPVSIASSNTVVMLMLRVTMIVAGLVSTEEPPSITKWLNFLPAGGASAVIVTELPSRYEPAVLEGSSSK